MGAGDWQWNDAWIFVSSVIAERIERDRAIDAALPITGASLAEVLADGRAQQRDAFDPGDGLWLDRYREWRVADRTNIVRFTDGFREHTPALREHWVHSTWIFDVQGSYDFTFATPVETQPVAGYSKDGKEMVRGKDGKNVETGQTANYSMPCWKNLLNNTTITVGCNNVFGQDPPQAFGEGGNSVGYPGFTYDATGRFVYVRLTKKF